MVPPETDTGETEDQDSPAAVALQERWDVLVPHVERLSRLVRSRLGDCHEVDDCVQETLLRAACFADLDMNRVGPFLTTTALRLCIDQYRDRDRQYRLRSRLAFPDVTLTPEETTCERLLGRWLLNEARHLPSRERQVMLARADGLSTAEAARLHNITVKAAESAFTRGRSRLLEAFECDQPGVA